MSRNQLEENAARSRTGLINDRAVREIDKDRLGHRELARELSQVVLHVDPPCNIALYGRWGSGKTSVSNFLKDAVQQATGAQWIYFDAFKWSGTALRRHFLVQVAEQLEVGGFQKEALYEQRSSNQFTLDRRGVRETLRSASGFLAVMTVILAVAALLALGLDRLLGGGVVDVVVSAVIAPAALLGVVGLTLKTLLTTSVDSFRVRHSTEAPSSEEQFESTFRELLAPATSNGDRVVVFIDELDRCSADELVATLEAVRTFLDVSGCVCVVAADKHVMEQALSRAARQETPVDRRNPYYSSGSAYLEKVFAHQVSLPPALPRRLSALAAELVEQAGGAWDRVSDPGRVVTVLIPTHVTSLRRVKALLNAYALSHEVLRLKIEQEVVRGPLRERELELAKYVCLQLEFPLFARELADTPNLPDALLREAPSAPSRSDREVALARRFLRRDEPVEVDISRDSELSDNAPVSDGGDGTSVGDATVAAGAERSGGTDTEPPRAAIGFTDQLVSYLRKTLPVGNPRGDLIHMESSGSFVDLDPALAERIENLAVDRDIDGLAVALEPLAPGERENVVVMLATQLKEAFGVEADNLLTSLFALLSSVSPAELAAVANTVADIIDADLQHRDLQEQDLPGAYVLGVSSTRPSGDALVRQVLAHDDAVARPGLGRLIVESLDRIEDPADPAVGSAVAHLIVDPDEAQPAAACLAALPRRTAAAALSAARPIVNRLVSVQPALSPEEDGYEAQQSEINEQLEKRTGAVISAYEALSAEPELCLPLFLSLLPGEPQHGRDTARSLLDRVPAIQTSADAQTLLRATQRRRPREWPQWLSANNADVLAGHEPARKTIAQMVRKLWTTWANASKDRPVATEIVPALAQFATSTRFSAADHGLFPAELGELADNDLETVAAAGRTISEARRWAAQGLLDPDELAGVVVELCLRWMDQRPSPNVPNAQVNLQRTMQDGASAVSEWVRWVVQLRDDAAQRIMDSLTTDASHVPSPWREEMLLVATVANGEPSSPLGPREIHELLDTFGVKAAGVATEWLASFAGSGLDVLAAVSDAVSDSRAAHALGPGLLAYSERANQDDVLALLDRYLRDRNLPDMLVSHLNRSRVTDVAVADQLSAMFDRAGNNDQRERVLKIWEWLGPTDEEARRTLIQDVYIPLCVLNKGAAELAIRNAELVQHPPHGTKGELEAAAGVAISKADAGKKGRNAFRAAGLKPVRRKFSESIADEIRKQLGG